MTQDRTKDIAFLKDPFEWPHWPYLPMKRKNAQGVLEFATLVAIKRGDGKMGYGLRKDVAIYDANFADKFKAATPVTYSTPLEVLDAGWLID